MTPLRQRMLDDMRVRKLSVNTRQPSVRYVAKYAQRFGKSPECLGPENVGSCQVYLINRKKASLSVLNTTAWPCVSFAGIP